MMQMGILKDDPVLNRVKGAVVDGIDGLGRGHSLMANTFINGIYLIYIDQVDYPSSP